VREEKKDKMDDGDDRLAAKHAKHYPYGIVKVEANAVVDVQPDLLTFTCRATANAPSVAAALSAVNIIRDKFVDALTRYTPKQIKIISEKRGFDEQRQKNLPSTFTATLKLLVEIYDLTLFGAIVDMAVAYGFKDVYDPIYFVREPQQHQLRALEKAAAFARDKAHHMAFVNCRELAELIESDETRSHQSYPMRSMAASAQSESAQVYRQPTTSVPETITFQAFVSATYSLVPQGK
jgi:uncharacterized protein YggE